MIGSVGIMASVLFYALIGVNAVLRPRDLLQGFGIKAESVDSRNEIRAVYGGFPLVVAGLLMFSLSASELADGILFALALASAGMAGGRIVSAAIDRRMGLNPAIFTALELIVAALIASGI